MPRRADSHRSTISIVGPGNLGTALATTLSRAGYKVASITGRPGSKRVRQARALARRLGAQPIVMGDEPLPGDIVWITVPDDSIAAVARMLAESGDWRGRAVFHSSGALTSDELAPLRDQGAQAASVHPMMTFVRRTAPEMAGVAFAVEGDASAVRTAKSIVTKLGGRPFVIRKENKVLYHVFGSFASPLVVALMATMEQVARAAGIRKQDIKRVMAPLLRQTLDNYMKRDAASALSGPLVRGDLATVRKHLKELEKLPAARDVYRALARTAVDHLPIKNRDAIARELRDKSANVTSR